MYSSIEKILSKMQLKCAVYPFVALEMQYSTVYYVGIHLIYEAVNRKKIL